MSARSMRIAWEQHLAFPTKTRLARRVNRVCSAGRTETHSLLRAVAGTIQADDAVPSIQSFDTLPVPKPRMTQCDRWAKRPCVLRYRAYADELRLRGIRLPHRYSLIFILPMPAGWSDEMKSAMNGQPNLRRPDATNLAKAVEDIVHLKDESLWDARSRKYWGYNGRLVVLRREMDVAVSVEEDATCPSSFLPVMR